MQLNLNKLANKDYLHSEEATIQQYELAIACIESQHPQVGREIQKQKRALLVFATGL